jgi:hypothetical protein
LLSKSVKNSFGGGDWGVNIGFCGSGDEYERADPPPAAKDDNFSGGAEKNMQRQEQRQQQVLRLRRRMTISVVVRKRTSNGHGKDNSRSSACGEG